MRALPFVAHAPQGKLLRFALIATAVVFVACGTDATEPQVSDDETISLDGGALGLVASAGGATGATAMLPPLPAELKLSDAQRAAITQLISAFQDATRTDMTALGAIMRRAEEARKSGKSEADVRAILAEGATIKARMEAANNKLRADIEAVLTAEQKAFIKAHQPKPCNGNVVLTQAQQTQIRTLIQSFEAANRADLVAVANIMEEARRAKQAGKSETDIRAILQKAAAAQTRLEAAHRTLQTQIEAVLTPEQKASGCFTPTP